MGEAEALGHRVVWKFPDIEGSILWLASTGKLFFSSLRAELFKSEGFRFQENLGFSPEFFEPGNAWCLGAYPKTYQVLQELSSILGRPQLILPWQAIASRVIEELNLEEEDSEPDIGTLEERTQGPLLLLLNHIAAERLDQIRLPWKLILDWGSGFLPAFSRVAKFNVMLSELEDLHGWAIIRDECCGTCSTASIEAIRNTEGMENSPIFFTWEQYSQATWGTDGRVSHSLVPKTNDELKTLISLCSKFGLEINQETSSSGGADLVHLS